MKLCLKAVVLRLMIIASLFAIPEGSFAAGGNSDDGQIDVKEIVLGHLSDSYEWHIATWREHHISISLPVIVKSKGGEWHVFSSSRLSEGKSYMNFRIDDTRQGKIYETLPDGTTKRPLDLSITKDVLQIWIVVITLILIFVGSARWYRRKKPSDNAPRGFIGLVEMFTMMVINDIIKPSIGEKHYRPYTPFLLTAFFFIFITNLLGLVPIFPGGANVTGNITITFVLSIFTFLLVNIFGNKEYWKDIFWPDVPVWLKVPIPMMPVIEFFGIFTKPFALMVRLFANMMGGHAIILSFTCVIFIACQLGIAIGASLTAVSFLLMVFMNCVELLVAFIQAYVFTMLSAVFIGLAHQEMH